MDGPCAHPEWGYEYQGNRWIAETVKAIQEGVPTRWCSTCGEMWFYEHGKWVQHFWTAEEIAEVKERAKQWSTLLGINANELVQEPDDDVSQ